MCVCVRASANLRMTDHVFVSFSVVAAKQRPRIAEVEKGGPEQLSQHHEDASCRFTLLQHGIRNNNLVGRGALVFVEVRPLTQAGEV